MKNLAPFVLLIAGFFLLLSRTGPEREPSGGSAPSGEDFLFTGLSASFTPAFAERSYIQLDGDRVKPEAVLTKPVLVNYWATWCAPCIREMPSLIRAADKLENELTVLLASEESTEQIELFLDDHQLDATYIVRLEGGFDDNMLSEIPFTVLYDSSGERVTSWLGSKEWDTVEALDQLRQLVSDAAALIETQ